MVVFWSLLKITGIKRFSLQWPRCEFKYKKWTKHLSLLLASFRFVETQYLHFTTRMFGHSAITPFLGGCVVEVSVRPYESCKNTEGLASPKCPYETGTTVVQNISNWPAWSGWNEQKQIYWVLKPAQVSSMKSTTKLSLNPPSTIDRNCL